MITVDDYAANPNLLDGTVYAYQFHGGELLLTIAGRDDKPYIIHFPPDEVRGLRRIVAEAIGEVAS